MRTTLRPWIVEASEWGPPWPGAILEGNGPSLGGPPLDESPPLDDDELGDAPGAFRSSPGGWSPDGRAGGVLVDVVVGSLVVVVVDATAVVVVVAGGGVVEVCPCAPFASPTITGDVVSSLVISRCPADFSPDLSPDFSPALSPALSPGFCVVGVAVVEEVVVSWPCAPFASFCVSPATITGEVVSSFVVSVPAECCPAAFWPGFSTGLSPRLPGGGASRELLGLPGAPLLRSPSSARGRAPPRSPGGGEGFGEALEESVDTSFAWSPSGGCCPAPISWDLLGWSPWLSLWPS